MGWLTRFLAAVAFLAVGVVFSPETFGSLSKGENSATVLIFLKLAHLLSFATAWGAALWATFIRGIIMFKNLPRHQFGNLQSKMFPAYFTLVGSCCAISLCFWLFASMEVIFCSGEVSARVSHISFCVQSHQFICVHSNDHRYDEAKTQSRARKQHWRWKLDGLRTDKRKKLYQS